MKAEEFCRRYGADRTGTSSVKWEQMHLRFKETDLLPLWVADMEFKAPECVTDAMRQRVEHGVFGYSFADNAYYDACIAWQRERYGFAVKKEWIRFSAGIVSALYALVRALTQPEDAVAILSPVYYPFREAIENTGRQVAATPLFNQNGRYTVDFAALEAALAKPEVKLFLLCSPHNPVGRVWSETELDAMLALCQKHGVVMISDEIHQDIVIGPAPHCTTGTVAGGKYLENIVTLTAPSKTFNLAGLVHAHITISNPALRAQYDAYCTSHNLADPNIFGLVATQTAYAGGHQWLEGLLDTIRHNDNYVRSTLQAALPKVVISPLEGTYLLWIDLRAYVRPEDMQELMENKCRLAVDYGEWFGPEGYGFIRMNLGTQPENVELAVGRLLEQLAPTNA